MTTAIAILLSDAAAQYRHDGDATTALKLEAVLSRLDNWRPIRVVDLDAAMELARAKLAPLELIPRGECEVCGEPTSTPPLCERHQRQLDDEKAAKAWREGRYE